MSILIIFNNKNPEPWAKKLKQELPNTTIETYPNVKAPANVEFIICWKPEKNILKKFPNVKVIQSVGASIDHIVSSQDINNNIILSRIVDSKLSNDMWEYLISTVLNQIKNLDTYLENKNNKKWEQHNYQTINDTVITILGLGKIGKTVASNFSKIGFKVKGWSTSKKEITNVECFYGKQYLDVLLKNTSFLINILPLTIETENILNKNLFEKLPKDAIIINVGRGEHLVENDLISFLDSNQLQGAYLDVFREEPLPLNHPFWNHSKIKITPHIASLTDIKTASNQVIQNYKNFLNNRELLNIVSINKGY
ncbi:glyoxylate/hydroxypyruvate reductase A [Tenacibaculum sp. E3R01]|uniref:2-hydroxyacid dehydrogenase n=1 Tax=Tenacibaculum sp. E3R01 TaxID=2267227 RepID=UPI000DEA0B7C|nr:glyoxylate/hydroxypyruvate reductase A [Tenacibaculum sp. E3R01]RBW56319.1 glyoxylate/hydroxypyruvate reductase A [Tenacibaculum sp. E3R01]